MGGFFNPLNPFAPSAENALAGLLNNPTRSLLTSLYPTSTNALLDAFSAVEKRTKRKTFFSFHFDDIMRVNNVRQAWKIDHPDAPLMRSFYDSSLWEARKLEGDDAIKRLIREGVSNASAVCVLVGKETFLRQWVRYEIARSVIDDRGLLAVHLNNIASHVTRLPDPLGASPLDFMAVGKVQATALTAMQYYLFEWKFSHGRYGWFRYDDYTLPVNLPRYLVDMEAGFVRPLSAGTFIHDYALSEGHRNIGSWIDCAAQQVGR